MRAWTIGEVARLLGVKPHVIRYWESELPLLSPKKGLSGRREYSANDVRLLMRFRHLLYEQKFTIEGAKNRLWAELGSVPPDIAARFAEIRSDLIDALMTSRHTAASTAEWERMPPGEPPLDPPARPTMEPELDFEPAASAAEPAVPVAEPAASAAEPAVPFTEPAALSAPAVAAPSDPAADLRRRFEAAGQGHLFAHWADRPPQMRNRLLDDLATLDLSEVQQLRNAVTGSPSPAGAGSTLAGGPLEPAPYVALEESRRDPTASEEGEEAIRRGTCAFLTVAGGQGSRLGFDGPKGMFPVTPIRKLTLFALFAEKLLAARRRYGARIPWLVMTGPQNHAATEEYFRSMGWFGLGRDSVHLFPQAILPSLSPDGLLVMAPHGGLFFNPNGHGGVIDALRAAGLLEALESEGVHHLFYFQVDNPLVRVPDPLFLGFHCRAGSQVSSKVIAKAYPEEKLGVIVTSGGRPAVIEYSDLDPALMHERAPDGRLRYLQGSPAIHLLDVSFLKDPRLVLPWHLARKKAKTLNPAAGRAETQERDVVKLERFIFDSIPLAETALFFETEREEEFSPLKNREGLDSIETCRQGQVEQAARWLGDIGIRVPRDQQGRSVHAIEISPLFASDRTALAARRGQVPDSVDADTLLA